MSDPAVVMKLVKVMFLHQGRWGNSTGLRQGGQSGLRSTPLREDGLLLKIKGQTYLVRHEVVEALYDLHQGIPR